MNSGMFCLTKRPAIPEQDVERILERAKILHYVVVGPHLVPDKRFSKAWFECAERTPYFEALMWEKDEFDKKLRTITRTVPEKPA